MPAPTARSASNAKAPGADDRAEPRLGEGTAMLLATVLIRVLIVTGQTDLPYHG